MKVRTLVASLAIAAALPLTSVWASGSATTLGGPQGTGFYGSVDPLTDNRNPALAAELRGSTIAGAGAGSSAPSAGATYDRNADGVISRNEQAAATWPRSSEPRDSYSGPSWATNPPAPAQ